MYGSHFIAFTPLSLKRLNGRKGLPIEGKTGLQGSPSNVFSMPLVNILTSLLFRCHRFPQTTTSYEKIRLRPPHMFPSGIKFKYLALKFIFIITSFDLLMRDGKFLHFNSSTSTTYYCWEFPLPCSPSYPWQVRVCSLRPALNTGGLQPLCPIPLTASAAMFWKEPLR